ncbi:MAG: hypothetical protein ACLFSV_04155 [Alkalispirochaeta sp.]
MRSITMVLLTSLLLSSCVTRYYAFDEDFNGKNFDGEYSEKEIEVRDTLFERPIAVEDFGASRLAEGMERGRHSASAEGALRSVSPGQEVGSTLNYYNPNGFESVLVCWQRTSNKGHLILWAEIPGFGMPTLFNDANGYGAHIHLDSLGGDTEGLGWSETASSAFIIQEIRVVGDEIQLLRNGSIFARYGMDRPRKIESFSIGNNIGGEGLIDYVIVR